MKYFLTTDDKLLQLNPETGVYRLRNTIERDKEVISKETFDSFDKKQIKKDEFSRLMNIYFKGVKHEWEYDSKKFRKMDNFGVTDYILGKDVPFHKLEKFQYDRLILIYHWGRIYYHLINYGGYGVAQLVCSRTHKLLNRWVRLKHASPIFCITDKRIC